MYLRNCTVIPRAIQLKQKNTTVLLSNSIKTIKNFVEKNI